MRVLCENCEGTGLEYPFGERSMRCACGDGTIPATMEDFDGHVVRILRGLWIGLKGIVAHIRNTWVVESEDGAWILVSPDPDDLEIVR